MSKTKEALVQAVKVIKMWHGDEVFDIYYNCSPEMKLIREALSENEQADAPDKLLPGVPCSHPGCAQHMSHPCEVCGRIACR